VSRSIKQVLLTAQEPIVDVAEIACRHLGGWLAVLACPLQRGAARLVHPGAQIRDGQRPPRTKASSSPLQSLSQPRTGSPDQSRHNLDQWHFNLFRLRLFLRRLGNPISSTPSLKLVSIFSGSISTGSATRRFHSFQSSPCKLRPHSRQQLTYQRGLKPHFSFCLAG
jgi:hypothetical protein